MGDRLVHRAAETPVIIDAGDQATVTQLHQAVAAQLGIAVDDGALTLDGWPLPDGLSLAAAGLVVGPPWALATNRTLAQPPRAV